jgi:hypothetical protein
MLVVLLDGSLDWDPRSDRFVASSTDAMAPEVQARFERRPLWLDVRSGWTDELTAKVVAALAAPAAVAGPSPPAAAPVAPPPPTAARAPEPEMPPSFDADTRAPEAASAPAPGRRRRRARWPLVVVPLLVVVALVLLIAGLVARGGEGRTSPSPPQSTAAGPTTTPTRTSVPGSVPPPTSAPPSTAPPTSVPATSSSGHPWLGPLLLVLAALVIGFGLGLWLSRRRRAMAAPTPAPSPAPWMHSPPATPLTMTASANDGLQGATVFISHNFDSDHPLAVRLANDLRPRVDVWIAPESIQPGESWLASVERGLNASAVFLALLSKAALASPWVLKEIQAAMELEVERRMHLLPVQVEDCDLPLLLRTYQVVRLPGGYTRVVDETVRLATPGRAG